MPLDLEEAIEKRKFIIEEVDSGGEWISFVSCLEGRSRLQRNFKICCKAFNPYGLSELGNLKGESPWAESPVKDSSCKDE